MFRLLQKVIVRNVRMTLNLEEYTCQNNNLMGYCRKASDGVKEIEAECTKQKTNKSLLNVFLRKLRSSGLAVTEFSDSMWIALIEQMVVWKDGMIEFTFWNGSMMAVK